MENIVESTMEGTMDGTMDGTMEISTFIDLYEFLRNCPYDDIISWLSEGWEGKDKQESILRLFAGLGIITKLTDYTICKGNFNLKTIRPLNGDRDIFYNSKNKPKYLKDKGDSSDLTGYHKTKKELLVTTSKNTGGLTVGKLEIDKILTNFRQYEDEYKMVLCVVIRRIKKYEKMKSSIENTSDKTAMHLFKSDTIVIDQYDLNEAYHEFKIKYKEIPIEMITECNKTPMELKMHQKLGVMKTLKLKAEGKTKILWGAHSKERQKLYHSRLYN